MLSIGKVGGGDADPRYYIDTVAQGAEDYYSGRGEAPGQWTGKGAAAQGLTGTVEDEPFLAQLTANPTGRAKKVLAYDLTFSAPKSVSLVYGIGDETVSRIARDAHDTAVEEALGYLERHACWTRRGPAGRDVLQGDGLTIATFRHRSSRAGDPQLHTHSVVVNATTANGRTTALDGRALYAHTRTAGFLYQSAVRAQLTRTLGVDWQPVENGMAEIAGFDDEVLRHFSQRRTEILERMAGRAWRSARSAEIAALATRKKKEYNVPADRLRDEWRARASEMGLGAEALQALLDRRAPGRPVAPLPQTLDEDLHSPDGITRQASTFDRRDVLREIAGQHREGASVADVEALADTWLQTPDVVRLEAGDKRKHLGGARHSTRDMLELEKQLVDSSAARRDTNTARVAKSTVDQALAEARVGGEQAELVRQVTQSGDGVQVIRSAAGTGKTRALAVARDAWERDGTPVFGCALAARAAVELESAAGIDSTTIARFLQDVERGYGLQTGSVLVVDEAGMVGSRTIDRLAQHAADTESKLLLVGDDRQLPEIDAGGAFRGLADRLGAVELKTVVRQSNEWDRDALADLRVGKVRRWLDAYRDHGRIVAMPGADETRAALVDDWWESARTGDRDAVMIAHRRADVRELNELARARMHRDGRLGTDEVVTAEGRPFAVGDYVLARRNDRRADVVNGMRGTVVDVDLEHRSVTVQPIDGHARTVQSQYLDEGSLDHGYALTAHAAQGATVDRAYVLGSDDLYREWGYTALTRHRDAATFYVVSPGSSERALPGLEPDPDPLARDVGGMLGPSRRKELAIDVTSTRYLDAARRRDQQAPAPSVDRQRADIATEEIAAAQARIQALTAEREELGIWQRAKRKEIDTLVERQREAVTRWEAERSQPQESPAAPASRRAGTPEPAMTMSIDELRASVLRPPAALEARIGGRPDRLSEREAWCRAAANLMGRIDCQPSRTLEVEALADVGLELD